jgi:hypothetical protein
VDIRREALLAASNNADWYCAVFRSLGLAYAIEDGVWTSRDVAPPYHSNALILSPAGGTRDRKIVRALADAIRRPFSVKDGFATHDLSADGFRLLFEAQWIWRDAGLPLALGKTGAAWHRVRTPGELAAWEAALRANGSPAEERTFLPSLLDDPSLAFFIARDGDRIIAGFAANLSPEVVGFSNFFAAQPSVSSLISGAVAATIRLAPDLPIVGFDQGDALIAMHQTGFRSVQPLRVWLKTGK